MTRMIFIGATGTDIGKTYVTCMLLRQLRRQGYNSCAIKPVISGFDVQNIEQSDSGQLLTAMDIEPTQENICKISPWRFTPSLPPHLAADQTGSPLNFDDILSFCQTSAKPQELKLELAQGDIDFLLIEGSGGILTPLNYDNTTLDLMAHLDCTCLLVTGSYLGTLSHTISAISCLEQRQIEISGIIVSESMKNYTDFETVTADFSKIITNIPIKYIRRNDSNAEISALIL